jgi:argonaute-like protein implicated in RNA metabolism and viral defense
MNKPKKSMPEIRADLEKVLSEIIAECYLIRDDLINDTKIRGVYFKTFLIDRADQVIEQQKFLNNNL